MTKKILLFLTVLFFNNSIISAETKKDAPRPKLVIGIMVDQMRWDYLYRYYDRYQNGGFKRLLNEGFSFENTYINHLPSITAIGHATVYTGSVPSVHGITGNSFIKNSTGKEENCVFDEDVVGVGTTSNIGKASPKNLLVTTIGDELRLASNFRSKVVGISFKDRAAILPAGHTANAAYWLNPAQAKWISSTYYMNELPDWVENFNNSGLAEEYIRQDWNALYPIETYIQSTEDENLRKNTLKGHEGKGLPIKTSELYSKDDLSVIFSIPQGNSYTLDFAKATIRNEKLGQGEDTDMLTINLASTDAAGHRFSINSIEVEDIYLRLDLDLATFFNFLDETIGKDNYTLFLSADHGGQHNPYFMMKKNIPLNPGISAPEIIKELNNLVNDKFGVDEIVLDASSMRFRLDYKKIRDYKLDELAVRDFIVMNLRKNPAINYVIDLNNPYGGAIPEKIRKKIINGFYPDRSGDIQVILGANALRPLQSGSGHSHWNPYDTKIPFLLYGWGIKKGDKSFDEICMEDIAPTITSLLRIQPPNGSIGTARGEAIDQNLRKN